MKRKRNGSPEINLTSLLDVLFCILFIVMLTSVQNEREYKTETQAQTEEMQDQIDTLQTQVQEYESSEKTIELYGSEAVIINMHNIKSGDKHILKLSEEPDGNNSKEITLGNDITEQTKRLISSYIEDIIAETDNQPIYIVFNINKSQIYTKEAIAIDDVLDELQMNNKEVFYKTAEEDN